MYLTLQSNHINWQLNITTGSFRQLTTALRVHAEYGEKWLGDALDSRERTDYDDEDSDVQVAIDVDTLAELRQLLGSLDHCEHLSGLTLFAAFKLNHVNAEVGLGRGWAEEKDQACGNLTIDEAKSADALTKSVQAAIGLLNAGLTGATVTEGQKDAQEATE